MTYDDDRIIAMLKDAVPALPAGPADRVEVVRRVAGRQRQRMLTQVTGTMALVVAVAGTSVALGGGVGGTTPAGVPADRAFSAAASAFQSVRTFRFEAGQTVSSAADSMFKFAGEVDLTVPAARLAVESADIEEAVGTERFEVILISGTVYQRIPEGAEAGKWSRSESDANDDFFGEMRGMFTTLARGARDVRTVGVEQVGGVRTTHYAGTAADFDSSWFGDMTAEASSVPVHLWLDDNSLPRQLEFTVPLDDEYRESLSDQFEALSPTTATVWMKMFDYGKPVKVSPPPESEVVSEEDGASIPSSSTDSARAAFERCTEMAKRSSNFSMDKCMEIYELPGGGFSSTDRAEPGAIYATPARPHASPEPVPTGK